jgi:hypothetical protein
MSRSVWRHCGFVCFVLLRFLVAPADGLADTAWQRMEGVFVPSGQCQELTVRRAGSRFLELRLSPEPLQAAGIDAKIQGASVFVPESGDRATILLYHKSGLYELSVSLRESLRWWRDGRRVCFASGSSTLACGVTNGEVRYAQRIAFGTGWESEVVPCSFPLSVPHSGLTRRSSVAFASLGLFAGVLFLLQIRYRKRLIDLIFPALLLVILGWSMVAWIDPWYMDPRYPLATLVVVGLWALIRLFRERSVRNVCLVGLSVTCFISVVRIPHPLQPIEGVRLVDDAGAPPLWVDTAYWHFAAPQQRLQFATRSVASLWLSDEETWLVLGGSVTAGRETGAADAFTAVAEQRLTADGSRVRLVNAGVPGWNMGQIDRFMLDVGDRLPIRGVVLASVLNNSAFPIVGPPEPYRCRTFLCAYTHNLRRNYLLFVVINFFLPKPANQARFEEMLDGLITRELNLGREVVLLDETHDAQIRPRWYNGWLGRPQERYRHILRRVAAAHGRSLHRVDDVVAALPVENRFVDGMHLTKDGHLAVGMRLAEILKPYLEDSAAGED